MINLDQETIDSIRKKMMWAALACSLGHLLIGMTALYGNTTLYQATALIRESGVENFNAADFNLIGAWWMIALSNFAFAIFNTLSVLVFCGLVYLYSGGDWRFWLAGLIQIIWIPIALNVDAGVAASAWINGIQNTAGVQPEQLVNIYSVVQERSFDMFRWPARGYYLFIGVAFFIVAKVSFERGWPKGISYAALLLAIALWLEVLTFAITVVTGSSPIHIPAYLLNFFIATPLWNIMVWHYLRKDAIPA